MSRYLTRASTLLLAGLLGVAATAAQADTTLTYQGASGEFTVDMKPGAVRIDDATRQWQLYEESSEAIFSIDPSDRSYTRLDRNTASAIRERVDALRAQIESRVQQLPEGQQATARAAMLQSVPGLDTSAQKVGLDRTGREDSVAGVPCEVVQVVRDGKPAETLCIASPDALGMSKQTFASVKSMFSLMQTMLAGTGFETAGLPYLSLSGMPVRFTDTNSGERRQLSNVAHDSLPEKRFTIPDGYIETAITQPGG
ncbi:DUF4412 domain-containing protein [Endozoicomonas sp. G2_2]|uniref:DUF4412 domain-containing protein n=1 Tax=Endozoicomonas sp. G2_2 TaxID=2821092 RepID=UPI001ADC73FF|nr:DUF4412 domain-containing protein [Endozoicomonas sp. G2_2]MBO9470090.1 DUF4412 domain-containing protein [Endozoicomonas sp. G2_2]